MLYYGITFLKFVFVVGDCYEHMYEWAQKEPLNAHHQPPGYHEHLKPLLSGQVIEEALKTLATAKL